MADHAADELRPGTVLKHRTQNRYLRVLDPLWNLTPYVYVRNTDGAGFELDNKARWLTKTHLRQRYVVHYAPAPGESEGAGA